MEGSPPFFFPQKSAFEIFGSPSNAKRVKAKSGKFIHSTQIGNLTVHTHKKSQARATVLYLFALPMHRYGSHGDGFKKALLSDRDYVQAI
jgi:hypothetical protein